MSVMGWRAGYCWYLGSLITVQWLLPFMEGIGWPLTWPQWLASCDYWPSNAEWWGTANHLVVIHERRSHQDIQGNIVTSPHNSYRQGLFETSVLFCTLQCQTRSILCTCHDAWYSTNAWMGSVLNLGEHCRCHGANVNVASAETMVTQTSVQMLPLPGPDISKSPTRWDTNMFHIKNNTTTT